MKQTCRDLSALEPNDRSARAGLLTATILGAASLAYAGTPIVDVETTLGGGNGVYMDLQSAAEGFTNQGVKGTWSNWSNSWGFDSQGTSTGDGGSANGPGDTSDSKFTVFGRSADDKKNSAPEIQVAYTGLVPNASYFFWYVTYQNTGDGISHDFEWGLESGKLTEIVGEPGFQDAAWIAGANFGAGGQLVGVPLGRVTADADGKLTLYYDSGVEASGNYNTNRTQIDGVLFEQIVDPHCLLPWAPNHTKIENNGAPETLQIKVTNLEGGTQDLVVTDAEVQGSQFDLFTVPADQFPITLTPGAEANIAVEFDPATTDFDGPLSGDNVLVVTSNHGGVKDATVRTPITGGVRNPWISTADQIDLGTIPATPGTRTFSVNTSNLGASVELEIYDAFFTDPVTGAPNTDNFELLTDLVNNPPVVAPGGDPGVLEFKFDALDTPGIYEANLHITSNDSMVDDLVIPFTVTVVESMPMQLTVTGYDESTGELLVNATRIPASGTFHLEQSTDLESFAPPSTPVDFDATTAQPLRVPVDRATTPKLFLQAFENPTP